MQAKYLHVSRVHMTRFRHYCYSPIIFYYLILCSPCLPCLVSSIWPSLLHCDLFGAEAAIYYVSFLPNRMGPRMVDISPGITAL